MKKIVSMLLATSMVLSLAACGTSKTAETTAAGRRRPDRPDGAFPAGR